mmetsp:Transcript_29088/g.76780  ORF Transcript_29088/g.76780 Transcript_29088/m.76780 type:complete len:135 (-) Transcript_29088:73-477(-)
MLGVVDGSRRILDHRAAVLLPQIILKVCLTVSMFVYLLFTLLLLVFLVTLVDLVLRLAASQSHKFSLSKHGSDVALIVAIVLETFACSHLLGLCRALRLVLPFLLLVSAGGNLMRLGRTSKPPTPNARPGIDLE